MQLPIAASSAPCATAGGAEHATTSAAAMRAEARAAGDRKDIVMRDRLTLRQSLPGKDSRLRINTPKRGLFRIGSNEPAQRETIPNPGKKLLSNPPNRLHQT